jgi:hypothetical protein
VTVTGRTAEHHGGRPGAEGQRGELRPYLVGGHVRAAQPLHGPLGDLVADLAVHDQRVVDLAVLDHATGHVHAVEEGQARVAQVEVQAGVRETERAVHDGGGGRLDVVAADAGADQHADPAGVDARLLDRLPAGQRGAVGDPGRLVPVAPLADAGDHVEQVGADADPVKGGAQPLDDGGGGDPYRRVDVRDALHGNAREQHGPDFVVPLV